MLAQIHRTTIESASQDIPVPARLRNYPQPPLLSLESPQSSVPGVPRLGARYTGKNLPACSPVSRYYTAKCLTSTSTSTDHRAFGQVSRALGVRRPSGIHNAIGRTPGRTTRNSSYHRNRPGVGLLSISSLVPDWLAIRRCRYRSYLDERRERRGVFAAFTNILLPLLCTSLQMSLSRYQSPTLSSTSPSDGLVTRLA